MDTEKTKVVFRKWKSNGDIIALFPNTLDLRNGSVMSYEHIGQHGDASPLLTQAHTVPARPMEYEALRRELESIGYNLEIKKRMTYGRI